MKFYVTEQLSPRQGLTPEGFLVCYDVPITRTGTLLYGKDEVPIDADATGMVQIDRMAEDVFRPETIASFEGKPVTISHPDDLITPETWKSVSVGITQNVRRGEGAMQDLLLSDLIVMDAEAIREVKGGLREVSCGYDADYEQIAPGRGYQKNIIGNHVALVLKGRAGSRCSIQDHKKEKEHMTFKDKMKKLFPFISASTIDAVKDDDIKELMGENKETGDAAAIDKRFKDLEGSVGELKESFEKFMEEEAKEKEHKASEDKKTKDDAEEAMKKYAEENGCKVEDLEGFMAGGTFHPIRGSKGYSGWTAGDPVKAHYRKKGDAAAVFKDSVSRAEILKPGIAAPTFDEKIAAEQIKGIKINALKEAYTTDQGKAAIEPFTRGPVADFAALDQATLDAAFIGASELIANANNKRFTPLTGKTKDFGKPTSASDINKRNREFWAGRKI